MVVALSMGLFTINGAQAEGTDYLGILFPGCGPVRCVVKSNFGGSVLYFDEALMQMAERHVRLIVIDGPCASACASVVDRARKKGIDACLTTIGELGFHKGTKYKTDRFGDLRFDAKGDRIFERHFDQLQTPNVLRWIKRRHGFPVSDDFEDGLWMNASNTQGTFRICRPDDIY